MNKELLSQFFQENAVQRDIPTAPSFAHFHMKIGTNPEADEKIHAILSKAALKHQPKRKAELLAEKSEIESAADCEQIIRFMRRNTDSLNHHLLISKAMEFEDEIVPEIIKKLKKSLSPVFIEIAVRILAKSETDVTEELIGCFDDVRNPYAQSMILVALGFKADETRIPWFIEKYKLLKKLYPYESYHEGAYYGLFEMWDRFYS